MSAHLYIHVPFCGNKCLYCDFFSVPGRKIPWERFLNALTQEARCRKNELPEEPTTIYLGGGTPSLMPGEIAAELLSRLRNLFGSKASEITIELNPDDVNSEYVDTLLRSGYNRFSMGIQSFDDTCLRTMGRRHTSAQAIAAAELLKERNCNMSLDLIFGLPHQTFEIWKRDVATAIALNPSHISCYSLMLEEGTPLTRMVNQGRISVPDDSISAQMYRHLQSELNLAGYRHYEISNFALPGYESRHNSAYWNSSPYLGLGPGAHSYDGSRRRRFNPTSVEEYLKKYADREESRYSPEDEVLSTEDLAHEYLLTRLRTARGLSEKSYEQLTGEKSLGRLKAAMKTHLESGNLIYTAEGRIRIPESKWLTADTIISSLF